MRRSQYQQYVRFREDFDHNYLGTAMEDIGVVSKFFFVWVNRLMEKGAKDRINRPEDMYDLPDELTSMHQKCLTPGSSVHGDASLFSILHRRFAMQFYGIGVLKLIADLAGLASPLLLRELLLFIETPGITMFKGYLYAVGILLAAMVGPYRRFVIDFRNIHGCVQIFRYYSSFVLHSSF